VLDGGASRDADGDPLSYRWSLTVVPTGSAAVLSDPAAQAPSFVPDVPGTYVAQLIVNDGTVDSAPDTTRITTTNAPPVADAGPDQTPFVGTPATLDGGASSDPDGGALTFQWTIVSKPAASTATLGGATAVAATLVPDVRGTYVIELAVSDGFATAVDTVQVTTLNRPPVVDAGPSQTVDSGTLVTLGGGGTDADGDPVTFLWTFASAPPGSAATLANPTSASPSFVADRAGQYVAQLVGNDGIEDSAPSFVTIDATPPRLQLNLLGTPLIGVGRSAQLQVVLPRPAPPGGVTVTVTSDVPGVVAVTPPGTVAIAEGGTTGIVTASGVTPGPALLRAGAPEYAEGTATLTVTNKLVNLPDAFSVPLGQQAGLLVSISPDPAPAGGLVVQLTTSDESIIAVSASVTILPGQFSASATVAGVRPGTAIVSATNPEFATDAAPVSTAAQLNITETSRTFNAGFTAAPITVRLESAGVAATAPSPGVFVTVTSSNPSCATGTSVNIGIGLSTASSSIAWGGTTTLPCTATLTAASPGVTPDTILVTVNPKPALTLEQSSSFPQIFGFPVSVGAGLVTSNLRAFLGVAAHGGATVTIESSDPSKVLVSPNASTPGSASIDVVVPNNQTTVNFVVHGLEGVTGSSTITASEPRFTSATGSATVVQPVLRQSGLVTPIQTLANDRAFNVQVGTSSVNQAVRAGGSGFNVTVTSSDPVVGDLSFGGTIGAAVTAPIGPGASQTASILFRPRSAGTTVVGASAPGAVPPATFSVTVTAPAITLEQSSTFPQIVGFPVSVGAGLVTSNLRAFLSAGNHGGATVRIESNDPSKILVSPNASTPGTQFIDVVLPNNQTTVNFVAHGMESATGGTAIITASEPRFTGATGSATVVQPVLRFSGLVTPIQTLTNDRAFSVQVGTATLLQSVRPGGSGWSVTVTSSDPAVGDLSFGGTTGGSVTAPIGPGAFQTANILFRPRAAGTTVVGASAPGTVPPANFSITVTQPVLTFETTNFPIVGFPVTVGAGLQTGNLRVFLSAGNHGGATIHIESSDPTRVLVSPNASTPGTASIDVVVANTQTIANFIAHGLEGVTGSATITASEPRFGGASGSATVLQPVIRFNGLSTGTISSLAPNVNFSFLIGAGTLTQPVRTGGAAVPITVTSSNPAVGDLLFGGVPGSSGVVSIAPGSQQSTSAAFRPRSNGSTVVSASAPGTLPPANVTMTVTTPVINMTDSPGTIGSGLQGASIRAFLGAANHGGATVRVRSSNPAIALVAPNVTTPGTEFFDVTLANNVTQVNYVVQGVEGQSGGVIITVSSDRFTDGNINALIVPAHVRIDGLPATKVAGSADDPFNVQIGIPNADGSNLLALQNVRAGGTPVSLTLTSSNPAAGALVSGGVPGATASLTIVPLTNASASVSFRPLAAGSTTVGTAVTSPAGVVVSGAGTVNVTVNP
jgi:hypothetical protein